MVGKICSLSVLGVRSCCGGALRRAAVTTGRLRVKSQRAASGVGDDQQVLHPDTSESGKVHARLDGKHISGLEHRGRARGHPGQLVDVQSDTVARAVHEGVAHAGLVYDRPAGSVDLPRLDARAHRADAGRLAAVDDIEHGRGLTARIAQDERAGHVAAIAVHNRPDVDDHEIAGLYPPVGGGGMGEGAVGTRSNDRVVGGARRASRADGVVESHLEGATRWRLVAASARPTPGPGPRCMRRPRCGPARLGP